MQVAPQRTSYHLLYSLLGIHLPDDPCNKHSTIKNLEDDAQSSKSNRTTNSSPPEVEKRAEFTALKIGTTAVEEIQPEAKLWSFAACNPRLRPSGQKPLH
jgi:hypothetical protein